MIKENDYSVILDDLLSDLTMNYEKVNAMVKDYHDYKNQQMIKVLADNSVITPKNLLEYFKVKYHGLCGEHFIKQVIDDWYFDRVKDGMLSKNITVK